MALSYASGTISITSGKDAGTATSGGSTTLTDSSKSWTVNAFANRMAWIRSGTGAGQYRRIESNTATALTVDVAWSTNPDATSVYVISYNFQDLVDAALTGISKTGTRTFILTSYISATANAFLHDYDKAFICEWGTSQWPFYFDTSSSFALGFIDADGYGWSGGAWQIYSASSVSNCDLMSNTSSGGDSGNLLLYAVQMRTNTAASAANIGTFIRCYRGSTHLVDFVDCSFINVRGGGRFQGANSRIKRCTFQNCTTTIAPFTTKAPFGEIEGISVVKSENTYYWNTSLSDSVTISGLYGRANARWLTISDSVTVARKDLKVIDSDIDSKTILWATPATLGNHYLFEDYNYVPTLLNLSDQSPIDGARVAIYDSTGTQVHNLTTDANGDTGELLCNAGFYRSATGNTRTNRTPHTVKLRNYGHQFQEFPVSMASRTVVNLSLLTNNFVVATYAAAIAYTGVSVTGLAITLSSARTLQEVYDYTQAWLTQSANVGTDVALSTIDGSNFTLASTASIAHNGFLDFDGNRLSGGTLKFSSAGTYDLTVGAITLEFTASGSYVLAGSSITGNITLINTSGGAVTVELDTGISYTNTGPSITVITPLVYQSVTVSGGIAATLIQLYDLTSSTELYNGTPASYPFTWTDPSAYAADREIRIRAMYMNGATAATLFVDTTVGTATELSPDLSFLLQQETDPVYVSNAVDGSAVTGITIDDTALKVNVSVSSISWADIYAYETYWLYTTAGIRDEGRFIDALDQANYIFHGFSIKNIGASPLVITGGYARDATTGSVVDIIDTTGQTIFPLVDHVVTNVVTVGGANVITGDIATVLSAVGAIPTNPVLDNDARINNLDGAISNIPAAVWSHTE